MKCSHVIATIALLMVVGLLGCGDVQNVDLRPPTPTISPMDSIVSKYVDCVNSRFPIRSTYGQSSVTINKVHKELGKDTLTVSGMKQTYASLGCGILKDN